MEETQAHGFLSRSAIMKKIMELFRTYRDIIAYLFFGGVTTVTNLAVYYLLYEVLAMANMPSVVIAWVIAVLVAFLTNKPFVFRSHDWSPRVLFPEAASFLGCRMGTGILELASMYLTVDLLHWDGMLMKLLVNILVVILNYVGSKLLVFRKK